MFEDIYLCSVNPIAEVICATREEKNQLKCKKMIMHYFTGSNDEIIHV